VLIKYNDPRSPHIRGHVGTVLGRIDEALETSINSRTETVVVISPDLIGGSAGGESVVEMLPVDVESVDVEPVEVEEDFGFYSAFD